MGAQEEEPRRVIENSLILSFTGSFYLIRYFVNVYSKLFAPLHLKSRFNQEIYTFFQRGSGQSTPHACLEENTTQHLIDDIEKLREHLEIPEWQVNISHLVFNPKENF